MCDLRCVLTKQMKNHFVQAQPHQHDRRSNRRRLLAAAACTARAPLALSSVGRCCQCSMLTDETAGSCTYMNELWWQREEWTHLCTEPDCVTLWRDPARSGKLGGGRRREMRGQAWFGRRRREALLRAAAAAGPGTRGGGAPSRLWLCVLLVDCVRRPPFCHPFAF